MRFLNCAPEEFARRCHDKKIICFGASRMPHEAAYEMPIAAQIVCVLDNDLQKAGSELVLEGKSVPVYNPDWLDGRDLTGHIILITSRFYHDIFQQLNARPELAETDCYAWACVQLPDESTPEKKYHSRIVDRSMAFYSGLLEAGSLPCEEKAKRLAAFKKSIEYSPARNILPAVVLLHSNICSLHCEECCDLIPKVKTPYYLTPDEIMHDFEILLRGVDMCVQADLTDGEVFLYKDLAELIDRVAAQPKVQVVEMITNGTVMPSEEVLRALTNEKVCVNISDYGFIEPLGKLIHCFEQRGIRFGVMSGLRWKHFGPPCKRPEARSWLHYDFLRCENKLCSKALFKGKLYGCMPAFRLADVGYFSSPQDSVSLLESDSDAVIAEKIRSLCMMDFIEACAWCRFCDQTVSEMPPSGEERSAYTIIKKDKLRYLTGFIPGSASGKFK